MFGRRSARRWGIWGLGLYGLAAAALLLSPFGPSKIIDTFMLFVHTTLGLPFVRQGWVEFGANIMLFVPVGMLVTLLFRRWWLGFAVSVVVSVGAELVQTLLPARLASPRDIVANALGGAIGSLIALAIIRWRRTRHGAVDGRAENT